MKLQRKNYQMGFNLTEVMISLALGVVVLTAALQMYESSQRGSRVLVASALLADQARSVANILSNELAKTPNWGCWSDDGNATTDNDGVMVRPIFNGVNLPPIFGLSDVNGQADSFVIFGASTSAASSLSAATDFANSNEINLVSVADLALDGAGLAVGNYVVISNCIGSDVVEVSAVDIDQNTVELTCAGCALREYDSGAVVSRVEEVKIFLDNDALCFSRDASDTDCSSDEELLSDVVDMQVSYGLDSNSDSRVDRYALAKHLTSADWKKIQSIEINLLLRSRQRNVFSANQTYIFYGDSVTAPDKALYKEVSITANLRNYKPY